MTNHDFRIERKELLDTRKLRCYLIQNNKTISQYTIFCYLKKCKAVPLQAWSGPEGSGKLRVPDFVTTAQDGGRLSALRTGRLNPQEMLLVLIYARG